MLGGSFTWIFSLGCVLGSSSVCCWRVPWLFVPGGVVERKYVLSVVWPVAAKVLDAATRKSDLSKNLLFCSFSISAGFLALYQKSVYLGCIFHLQACIFS